MNDNTSTVAPVAHVGTNLTADVGLLVWNINAREALKYRPGAILLTFLVVIGLLGNGLVTYVYNVYFKSTTANLFIKVLAIPDLLCCIFGIPFEIVMMFFPVLATEVYSCKIFKTLERTGEVISGQLLLLVAYDRYLHICKPFKVFTYSKAKKLIYISAAIGTLVSLPSLAIIGVRERHIGGIEVHECQFDPVVKDSKLIFSYFVAINLMFAGALVFTIGMYSRIWTVVYKWRNTIIGETSKVFVTEMSSFRLSMTKNITSRSDLNTESVNSKLSQQKSQTNPRGVSKTSLNVRYSERGTFAARRSRTIKPLIILFAVTVVFMVSFIPQFIISSLSSANVLNVSGQSLARQQWWEVAYKSYLISNVANPIIYATLDDRFRNKCVNILFRAGHYDRLGCRH